MSTEDAAPCRHRGAPPEEVVDRVADIIRRVGEDQSYLHSKGISADEFQLALPAAIERLRGIKSASNRQRRDFLSSLLEFLVKSAAITSYTSPKYGSDTVYRLSVDGIGDVAIIQKGCPDGKHSSVAWSAPEWAAESYLWWLCPSLNAEPGKHVSAGVRRLRNQFFSDRPDFIDGVIFHNELCGSDVRPCPKMKYAARIGTVDVPPPCVWIMPARGSGPDYNWAGSRKLGFPAALFSAFGISASLAPLYTGHVGFQSGNSAARTTITSRFGAGCSTTSRS
jgi:hypothetical protein